MEELLDLGGPVATWVQQWGYLAVFFGIMLENAGIPIPGETIIVLASALAGQGILDVRVIYVVVVAGAIIGDNIGYMLGAKGGRPLLLKLARLGRISEAQVLATEEQFRKHSDWAVFFGRFVALLRIFAGPLAGIVQMSWPRFFAFNAAGAVLWAAVVVGIAYKLGEHAHKLLHNIGLTALAVVVLGALWLGFTYWRKQRTQGEE